SRAGKRSAVGDDEGVDADQLPMRVHQRTAGVALVDGRVRLDKVARLARIVRIRVGPVECAHNATRDRELEVTERAAECEHSLPRLQLGRVAPYDGWQIARAHLDHGEIVELVHADYLRTQDAAIV